MEFEVFESLSSSPAPAEAASPLVRLQYLIDNTPAIIYTTVPSGDFKMTFVSSNAYNVLGYRPEEMLADPNFWFDHLHPDDAPSIFSSLAQLFVEGERTYEYRFRTASGEFVWMHDRLRLIRDEHGTPVEVIGSLTDITARKNMEQKQQQLIARLSEAHEQLLQSEKMASIGQLAAGVAHEINNPIGFVNSNLGSLQRYAQGMLRLLDSYAALEGAFSPEDRAGIARVKEEVDAEYLREDLEPLLRESLDGIDRVRRIVQDMKDFSHVDGGDLQYADIEAGLNSTLNVVWNEIKYKAEVTKEYGSIPQIECYPSQLNQVFMNLLVNAAHAIEKHGRITLRTGHDEKHVWIEVEDTGTGIPEDRLGRIFEPFFTTKPVGKGTGLGLSLSYGIVQKHGGRFEVKSEVGKGTLFRVVLPRFRPVPEAGVVI